MFASQTHPVGTNKMSFKTILVPLSDPDTGRTTLETALLVARRWDTHIDTLHVRPDPRSLVPYTGEGMDGSMIEEIMDATERERARKAEQTRHMFDSFCETNKLVVSDTPTKTGTLTISWREEIGREDEIVSLRGRLHDLIVVGRPMPNAPLPSPITLEAALYDSGRPILAAPPTAPKKCGAHIAIAWEASPEAARTIAVSIQALTEADKVTVLSANISPPLPLTASELVTRLKWHGVDAEIRSFDSALTELGQSFLKEAMESGADLLIKGAYSQSRLRQIVLGGRTRYILNNSEIPVLLAR